MCVCVCAQELSEIMKINNTNSAAMGGQFDKVAKLIEHGRHSLESERQIYFTSGGGWDTHGDRDGARFARLTRSLDKQLNALAWEIKRMGLWDNVTIIVYSEMGRNLASNGAGKGFDHGWGNIFWMMGGSVRGGQIHGKYPPMFSRDYEYCYKSRPIYIPSTPLDALWRPVADWFGANMTLIGKLLPNLYKFDEEKHLLQLDRVYETF